MAERNELSQNEKKTKLNTKQWFLILVIGSLVILGALAAFVAVVDPYFHYHAPLSGISYSLNNERYQNNGIVKNYEYDAIITGSSMTECFKPSELDALFGTSSIKVPYAGGSNKEVADNLDVAFAHNDHIQMVVRAIDYDRLFSKKDDVDYDVYPDYLYDDNPLNDASYLLNSEVLFAAIQNVLGFDADGPIDDTMDSYCNWDSTAVYGKAAMDGYYHREQLEAEEMKKGISEEEYAIMDENFYENFIRQAVEHPDTEFYYYFTPFSIYYFDKWMITGDLERQLLAEKHIIEMMLPYENIHLFSFFAMPQIITNADNYKDVSHHRGVVNTLILEWMKNGEGELTEENYMNYCIWEWDYFHEFDYDSLFD